ncbi:MAG: isocitrate lyase/PEP mutase family protein [Pelagimonas sp.]|uniref:isocitrate lyase/PEP mutase family protein n=1 Tax=Pelagimonas sp. TaxID=2073170 RepID=UPI003D6AA83F
MTRIEKFNRFKGLHKSGTPLVLYNIWDAGSAKAVEAAGAKAIATGSWSVAGAQGYSDGQAMPLDRVLDIVLRIAETTTLPVSIDFEGGYAESDADLSTNIAKLLETGVIGLNFEDQVLGGQGLHPSKVQARRIAVIRDTAQKIGAPVFINARTDVFLKSKPDMHATHLDEAKKRAAQYSKAGADGFFVPGLADPDLIRDICESVDLPINIMTSTTTPEIAALADLGVARVSYGPGPFRDTYAAVTEAAKRVF